MFPWRFLQISPSTVLSHIKWFKESGKIPMHKEFKVQALAGHPATPIHHKTLHQEPSFVNNGCNHMGRSVSGQGCVFSMFSWFLVSRFWKSVSLFYSPGPICPDHLHQPLFVHMVLSSLPPCWFLAVFIPLVLAPVWSRVTALLFRCFLWTFPT